MSESGRGASAAERWGEDGLLAPGFVHELRHPLMGLKAGLQMLERRLGSTVTADEAWALVTGQTLRLEELLRGYETFLQPGSVAPRVFVLQPVVRRSVELLGWRLRSLGEAFTLELPSEPVAVSGTPEALSHALTNLLVNALDANEEEGGGRRLAVRLLMLEGQGRVQVRVSDEGPGIPEELAPRLFEPRFTTKAPGRGSGLGLNVARRLMAEVGGSVRLVEPDDPRRLPWARSEFCLELTVAPLASDEPARGAVPVESPTRLTPTRSTPPPEPAPREAPARILVVDDEPIIVLLLRKALELEGHTVVTAARGEEALERLRSERFDLLVTDKNLPGPSGVELAGMARVQNPDVGIVLTTAYASRDSALAMLRLQADAYLTKPFDTEVLVWHVRQTLARRRSLARLREGKGDALAVSRVQEVLVVEPDAPSRALIVRHLQRLGLRVRVEESVLSGLRGGPPPDALVTPASLLGSEAREEIRRLLVRRPGFRVVVISEPRSMGDSITAIAVGAREQLVRPLGDAEVRRVLTQAFSNGGGTSP